MRGSMSATAHASPAPPGRSAKEPAIVAWQGWRLSLPPRWNPVKLEGDRQQGFALFADMYQPRLGMQWQTPGRRRFDADKWAQRAMRDEVGKLAADQAKPHPMPDDVWAGSLLYLEEDPPGRDVWVGYSKLTGRALKLTRHTRHRERVLPETILPMLDDTPPDQPQSWAVFELSCRTPQGLLLQSQKLLAGDLGLRFALKRQSATVRQIAVASLALQRMPMDKWIGEQQRATGKHYRPVGVFSDVATTTADGRELTGRQRRMRRRRRFFHMRWLPAAYVTMVLHDQARDRLVLVQATDDELARELALTVGWAQG
jgi:hypothetical protein